MTLSWRQLEAYLLFNDKLDRIDHTYDLLIATVGAQGDKQTIEKTFKDLTPE